MNKYVVVWLDNSQAQIFHVHPERFDESTIWAKTREVSRKSGGSAGTSAPAAQQEFFANVAYALGGAEEVLVVGPSAAKLELVQYANANDPSLSARIVGLETVEHPNDGLLTQYARRYFLPASLMR